MQCAVASRPPPIGSWRTYDISLGPSGFNLAGRSIRGIVIQDYNGAAQPAAYVDEISFRSVATASTTATATPSSTQTQTPGATATPTNTATPTASSTTPPTGGLVLYGDALAAGWANSSWNASVNLANAAPVKAGTKSIAVTISAAWGALYLTSATPQATTSYATLNFAMQASVAGQRFSVALVGPGGAQAGQPVVLASAGGDPASGAWKSYAIPLGAGGFNAAGQQIAGVYIQDYTGGAQPVVYVDEIALR